MLRANDKLELYATLAFYGIVGCLVRVGLNNLTGFEFGGIVWANVCGCVIMGFHKSFFPQEMHLHIGTGLCGSITSFSSLIVQLFDYSTRRTPGWNNGGYSVMAFLSFAIIQFSCCFSALVAGHHLGDWVGAHEFKNFIKVSRYLLPALAAAGWIAALVCAICIENGRNWSLMVLFAPVGVWGRYYLSRFNEPILKKGTFTVNIGGTIIAAICWLFLNPRFRLSRLETDCMHALMDGLSGNLSTISTFVNELFTMPRKAAYTYFVVSVGVGYICTLLIIGPYMWAHHSPYL